MKITFNIFIFLCVGKSKCCFSPHIKIGIVNYKKTSNENIYYNSTNVH